MKIILLVAFLAVSLSAVSGRKFLLNKYCKELGEKFWLKSRSIPNSAFDHLWDGRWADAMFNNGFYQVIVRDTKFTGVGSLTVVNGTGEVDEAYDTERINNFLMIPKSEITGKVFIKSKKLNETVETTFKVNVEDYYLYAIFEKDPHNSTLALTAHEWPAPSGEWRPVFDTSVEGCESGKIFGEKCEIVNAFFNRLYMRMTQTVDWVITLHMKKITKLV